MRLASQGIQRSCLGECREWKEWSPRCKDAFRGAFSPSVTPTTCTQHNGKGSNGRCDRAQLVAARVVVVVVNDNARGGDKVVSIVGCLVKFVKEYCKQENIGVLGVLLLILP